MVTKNQKKLIRSLKLKKNRKASNLFVAEGIKVINELLNASLQLQNLFVLKEEFYNFKTVIEEKTTFITPTELNQLSFLTTPQKAIALFQIPNSKTPNPKKGLQVALDNINDPGNLGTIIRLCDWFGVEELICSEQTVDCFNPKVIQATMGSITRVNITYTNLEQYLQNTSLPIFGTFMDGDNIYKTELPKKGIIVMGNEANGISAEVSTLVNQKVSIPRFGSLQQTESLNVATATAILLSEFRSNSFRN